MVSGIESTERSEEVPTTTDEYPASSPYVSDIIETEDAAGSAAAAVTNIAYVSSPSTGITIKSTFEIRQTNIGIINSFITLK